VLRSLHVRNLAVVAGGDLELGPGLNVLTGETGAGKSLVVDSLALLAGARTNQELIRADAESLTVSGVFSADRGVAAALAEAGVEIEGDELVIRREVTREGRSRAFVNDQPVTARLLADLAPRLLRIHGQREEAELAASELQRAWLDRSGGAEAAALAAEVAERFAEHRALAARYERLQGDERLRAERLDLLRFQTSEIDAARLAAGEEDDLRRERDVLRHADAIGRGLGGAFELLYEGEESAADRLAKARHQLADVAGWEESAAAALPELDELASRIGELGRALRARLDAIDADPRRLDEVEERLALVERLLRKYGATSTEVLERRRAMAGELAELEGDAADREGLEKRVAAALAAYRDAALRLSAKRAVWGQELATRLAAEAKDLALAKARFEVALERARRAASPLVIDGEAVDFGPAGIDRVVFQFAANPGEPPRPLARIASGGELSRVSLALQLAARGEEVEGGPTLVFDEVDAGVGGAEGAALGRKLRRLARRGQILAVTHLPQVASYADRHLKVGKRVRGGRTFAEVEGLDRDGRVAEIARMLSGAEVTSRSRSHAAEMLAGAAESKR
jgi:DNA repair protein RecN (Recombination protein N)